MVESAESLMSFSNFTSQCIARYFFSQNTGPFIRASLFRLCRRNLKKAGVQTETSVYQMSSVLEASYQYIKFEYCSCDILNVGAEFKISYWRSLNSE